MYCSKCGKELKEGVSFCSECGTKVGQEPLNNKAVPATSSNSVANANQNLMHHELTHDERSILSKRLDSMAVVYDKMLSYEHKLKDTKVPGFVVFVDCIWGITAVTGLSSSNTDNVLGTLFTLYTLPVFLVFLLVTLVILLARKSTKKKYNKYVKENMKYIYRLPNANYNDPSVLRHMSKLLTSYRVNTLVELYDRADEHLHRITLERQNAEIIRNQKLISSKLTTTNLLVTTDIGVGIGNLLS